MNEQPRDDYQTGRTYTSADISRRVRQGQPSLEPTPAMQELTARILAEVQRHERETVARRALAGDPNPTDLDALEYVRAIADQWATTDGRAALLDRLADELTLDDARAIRLAAEAVAAVTPRLIHLAAEEDGKTVPDIAAELGVTESYAYRKLREQRAAEAAPPAGEYRLNTRPTARPWNAFWTVERHEDGEWREQATQSAKTSNPPDALALALLDQIQRHENDGARRRVRVWKFGESETAAPLAEATTDAE